MLNHTGVIRILAIFDSIPIVDSIPLVILTSRASAPMLSHPFNRLSVWARETPACIAATFSCALLH